MTRAATARAAAPAEPVPDPVPAEALRRIARRFGTPCYAYDVGRMRQQVDRLSAALPAEVELLYSLKANPSLGLCGLLASWGLGADVASAGELLTALEAGFPVGRIFVGGPYKSAELRELLSSRAEAVVSVDSVSELAELARNGSPHRLLLRLRPDFDSDAVVDAGSSSRFGVPSTALDRCREAIARGSLDMVGFHVFSGSQILDSDAVVRHLHGAADLTLRAARALDVESEILNLGGGFGVPYSGADRELRLELVAEALDAVRRRAAPARVVLELGRYLVAQAGWYLTSVVGQQSHRRRPAVVVDGGVHQRADLCRLGLREAASPPIVLDDPSPADSRHARDTDVLGCLCLPDDVLAESVPLPRLDPGTVLAFPNAGAYGLSASPHEFLSNPKAAEAAFEGERIELLRPRPAAEACLDGQLRLQELGRMARGDAPA